MPVRYDQDTKAKAIGLVGEHAGNYPSEYAAITAVAGRLEMTPETLRKWIRQAAVDEGQAPEVTTEASQEICELSARCRWESTAKASSRGSGRPSWACSAAIHPALEVSCTRPAAGRAGFSLGSMSWVMTHE
jgi:transposase